MADLIDGDFRSLSRQLPGKVSMPGDDRYAAANRIWAKPVGSMPRAVVHCRTAEDVQAAIRAARERDQLWRALNGSSRQSAATIPTMCFPPPSRCRFGLVASLKQPKANAVLNKIPVAKPSSAKAKITAGKPPGSKP